LFCLLCFNAQAQTMIVYSPNGNEQFNAGGAMSIRWDYGSSNTVEIAYSSDNGSSWTTIGTATGTASFFNWGVIPNLNSINMLIRIRDQVNTQYSDVSNNTFKVFPTPTSNGGKYNGGNYDGYATSMTDPLKVLSPNGGERYMAGASMSIRWQYYSLSTVNIAYSTDNGSTFSTPIATVPASSGYFNWGSIVNSPSNQWKIRVWDSNNTAISDTSDMSFEVIAAPSLNVGKYNGGSYDGYAAEMTDPLKVLSPDGGEVFRTGGAMSIRWEYAKLTNVGISYSTDNGSSFTSIATVPATSGYYNWGTIPNSPSAFWKIRVWDVNNVLIADTSNLAFTVQANPTLQTGKYNGGNYDGYSTSTTNPLKVLSPNGGEMYVAGGAMSVRWEYAKLTNVSIAYSTDNGSSFSTPIATVSATSGYFNWGIIPNSPSTSWKLRVWDVNDISIADTSDLVFTVQTPVSLNSGKYNGGSYDGYATDVSGGPISVLSPNGGERYMVGSAVSIRWNAFSIASVRLSYSTNNGSSFTSIATVTASSGFYNWASIPNSPSTNWLIRVENDANTAVFDLSNQVFEVFAPITLNTGKYNGGSFDGYGKGDTLITCLFAQASLSGNTNVCIGNSTVVSFNLGGLPPWNLTYSDGSSSLSVSGVTSSPFTFAVTPTSNTTYTVTQISNSCGVNFGNGQQTLTLVNQPAVSFSGSASVCSGQQVNISAQLSGTQPWDLTYTDGSTVYSLVGITNTPFLIAQTPSQNSTYTPLSVYSGCAGTTSGTFVTTITASPTASISTNATICPGGQAQLPVSFTGNAPWNLTWTDGSSSSTVTGITQNPYTIIVSPFSQTVYSLTSLSSGSCTGSVSGSSTVYTNGSVSAVLSGNQLICTGYAAQITVNFTGSAPWDISYTNGTTSTTITGVQTNPYLINFTPIANSTYSLTSVSSPSCGTGTFSGSASVNLMPLPTGTISGTQTILLGQQATLTVSLQGNIPWSFAYSDGTTLTSITGITTSPYLIQVTPGQSVNYFLTSLQNNCFGSVSGNAQITVVAHPNAILSGAHTICAGIPVVLTTQLGGPGPWNLTWTDGSNTSTQLGITSSPFFISVTPLASTTYSLVSVTNPLTGTVSGTAVVLVNPIPSAVTGLQSGTAGCSNLTWNWNTVNGATAYYADAASDQNFTSLLPGWNNTLIGNTTSLTLTGLTPGQTVYLRVRGSNACGTSPDITGVSSSTLSLPGLISGTSNHNIQCSSFNANWNAASNATGYELEVSTQSNFSTLMSGYNPLTLSNVLLHTVTGLSQNQVYYWRVRGTNSCGVGSITAGILVNTANLADSFSITTNNPLCTGLTLQLSSIGNYSGSSFSWIGPAGYSSTQRNSSRLNMTSSEAGQYSLIISAPGCLNAMFMNIVIVNDSIHSISRGGNTLLCSGETLTLTANSQVNNVGFNWTGPNGFSGIGSSVQVNSITTAGAGTYTITATSLGCNQITDSLTVVVNVVQPVAVGSNSPVCEGSAIYLTANTLVGTQYLWTGPGAYSSNLQNPSRSNSTLTMSGQYTVSVTQPGCIPLTYTTNLNISPNPSTVQTTTNSPVCTGGNLSLTANSLVGASIVWEGPNGFSSTQFINSLSPASTIMSGQYTVTVSTTVCPSISRILNVVVHPPLVVSPGSNSPVCSGGVLQLSSPVSPNASYSWSGPNGFSSTQISPAINSVGQNQNGVYTLVVTQSGCGTMSGTTSVVVGGSLSNITSSTNSPICSGATLRLSSTQTVGVNYVWSGPGGYTSGNALDSVLNVTQSGIYTLVTSSPGCGSVTQNQAVTMSAPISSSAGAVSNPVCEGSALYLTSSTVSGGIYSWTGPNGFTSTQQNPSISQVTNGTSGTYSLVLTQPGCGMNSSTVSIVVGTSLSGMSPVSNSPVCVGNTLSISSILRTGVNYQWNGPNGFSSTQNSMSIPNVQQTTAGNYTLTVSSPGCVTQVYVHKVIVSNPGTIAASNNGPVCGGGVLSLFGTGSSGYSYQWSGPNSFISSLQNPNLSNAHYSQSGVYSLVVTVPNCGSYSMTTSVQIGANLNGVVVTSNSPICVNNTLSLSGTTIPGASYTWSGPNGFSSVQQFPLVNNAGFIDAGVYSLTFSTPGCNSVTRTHTVTVNPTLVSLPGSNSPICQGGAVYFSSNTLQNRTYSWSGPNGFTSTQSSPSLINVQPISSGTYTLAISQPGCGTAIGTTVIQVGTNLSNVSLGTNTPTCVGNTLHLSCLGMTNGSVTWVGPDGFTSNLLVVSRSPVQSPFGGVYTATITSPGCGTQTRTTGVSVTNVTLIPGSNSPICQGSVLQLSSNNIAGASYSWIGPLNFSSFQQNPSISNAQPTRTGIYTLSVSTPACGVLTSSTSVLVGSTLSSLAITSNSPICVGNTLNLTVTNRTGFTFSWQGPNGFTSLVSTPVVSPSVPQSAGRYTAVVSSAGCGSTTVQSNVIVVNNPASVTASATTPVCRGSAIYFTGTGPTGSTYSWSGPAGFLVNSQNPSRSNAQLTHAGVFTLNATVAGCGVVSATTTVVVNNCREGVVETSEGAEQSPHDSSFSFEVYPNPTNGLTLAKVKGKLEGKYQLQVLDVLGHVVLMFGKQMQTMNEVSWELDFGQLPKGVYFIQLRGEGIDQIERIVVQ
jgi:hypothetical protein